MTLRRRYQDARGSTLRVRVRYVGTILHRAEKSARLDGLLRVREFEVTTPPMPHGATPLAGGRAGRGVVGDDGSGVTRRIRTERGLVPAPIGLCPANGPAGMQRPCVAVGVVGIAQDVPAVLAEVRCQGHRDLVGAHDAEGEACGVQRFTPMGERVVGEDGGLPRPRGDGPRTTHIAALIDRMAKGHNGKALEALLAWNLKPA